MRHYIKPGPGSPLVEGAIPVLAPRLSPMNSRLMPPVGSLMVGGVLEEIGKVKRLAVREPDGLYNIVRADIQKLAPVPVDRVAVGRDGPEFHGVIDSAGTLVGFKLTSKKGLDVFPIDKAEARQRFQNLLDDEARQVVEKKQKHAALCILLYKATTFDGHHFPGAKNQGAKSPTLVHSDDPGVDHANGGATNFSMTGGLAVHVSHKAYFRYSKYGKLQQIAAKGTPPQQEATKDKPRPPVNDEKWSSIRLVKDNPFDPNEDEVAHAIFETVKDHGISLAHVRQAALEYAEEHWNFPKGKEGKIEREKFLDEALDYFWSYAVEHHKQLKPIQHHEWLSMPNDNPYDDEHYAHPMHVASKLAGAEHSSDARHLDIEHNVENEGSFEHKLVEEIKEKKFTSMQALWHHLYNACSKHTKHNNKAAHKLAAELFKKYAQYGLLAWHKVEKPKVKPSYYSSYATSDWGHGHIEFTADGEFKTHDDGLGEGELHDFHQKAEALAAKYVGTNHTISEHTAHKFLRELGGDDFVKMDTHCHSQWKSNSFEKGAFVIFAAMRKLGMIKKFDDWFVSEYGGKKKAALPIPLGESLKWAVARYILTQTVAKNRFPKGYGPLSRGVATNSTLKPQVDKGLAKAVKNALDEGIDKAESVDAHFTVFNNSLSSWGDVGYAFTHDYVFNKMVPNENMFSAYWSGVATFDSEQETIVIAPHSELNLKPQDIWLKEGTSQYKHVVNNNPGIKQTHEYHGSSYGRWINGKSYVESKTGAKAESTKPNKPSALSLYTPSAAGTGPATPAKPPPPPSGAGTTEKPAKTKKQTKPKSVASINALKMQLVQKMAHPDTKQFGPWIRKDYDGGHYWQHESYGTTYSDDDLIEEHGVAHLASMLGIKQKASKPKKQSAPKAQPKAQPKATQPAQISWHSIHMAMTLAPVGSKVGEFTKTKLGWENASGDVQSTSDIIDAHGEEKMSAAVHAFWQAQKQAKGG